MKKQVLLTIIILLVVQAGLLSQAATATDVLYGPDVEYIHPNEEIGTYKPYAFDIWVTDYPGKRPLFIYFHGGSSAGANMTLWIAMHNDFKDSIPDMAGTFIDYSSRVKCVTTDDPPALFVYYGPNIDEPELLPLPAKFTGNPGFKEILAMNGINVYEKYDDIFINSELPVANDFNESKYKGRLVHNKYYGEIMLDRMNKIGIPNSALSWYQDLIEEEEAIPEIVSWALNQLDEDYYPK